MAWGGNIYGESTIPIGLSGVTAIAAGGFTSVALTPTDLSGSLLPGFVGDSPVACTASWNEGVLLTEAQIQVTNGTVAVTPLPSSVGTPPSRFRLTITPTAPGPVTVTIPAGSVTGTLTGTSIAGDLTTTFTPTLTVTPDVHYTPPDMPVLCQFGHLGAQPALTYSIVTPPAHGTLGSITSGQVLYTPASGYTGDDTFTYQATNGMLTSAPATVTVHVQQVVAWGQNGQGQCSIPTGLNDVTAIATGYLHTVALKGDGSVTAWGLNNDGQCTIPGGLSGVTAIAAKSRHTVALKADGTVVAWGQNTWGQCNVPVGLSNVTAISAGEYHTVALKSDGTVTAWGYTGYDICAVPVGLNSVTAIVAGGWHTVALKADGSMVTWGLNTDGQCDIPAGLSGVATIVAGDFHNVALKLDGTVVAWGKNTSGQCTIPSGLNGVAAISAGYSFSLGLRSDGSLVGWGLNADGVCTGITGLPGMSVIAAGGAHAAALLSTTPRPVFSPANTTTGSGAIPLTITFNLPVSGFDQGDIAVTNASLSGFTAVSTQTYTATLTPAGLGPMSLTIPAGAATTIVGARPSDAATTTITANLTTVTKSSSCTERTSAVITLSTTDIPPSVTYAIATPPGHGSASITGNQLTYTPGGWFGTETITYTANNGAYSSAPATVTITVTAVNDAPVGAGIADQVMNEDSSLSVSLLGIGSGSPYESQSLTITAVSDTPGILPDPTVTYTSPNASGSLTLSPQPNAYGTATVTVTVRDNGGTANGGVDTSAPITFTVTVIPVNDPPTLTFLSDASWLEDCGSQTIDLSSITAGPANENAQTLALSAFSTDLSKLPNPVVAYTPGATTATLTCLPVTNANGAVTVFVSVTDNGGTANSGINSFSRSFVVNLDPVNDPPTVSVNPGFSVAVTGTRTISTDDLAFADVDLPTATTLVATIAQAPTRGEWRKGGVPLSAGGTFSLDDLAQSRITYVAGGTAGADSLIFTLSDGFTGAVAGPATVAITVTSGSSAAPIITLPGAGLTWTVCCLS